MRQLLKLSIGLGAIALVASTGASATLIFGDKNHHIYGQYTILLDSKERRDKLKEYLRDNGVESAIFYPISIHTQKVFNKFGYKEGDFIVSEDICQRVLSLPCYPELDEKDIENICQIINKFL